MTTSPEDGPRLVTSASVAALLGVSAVQWNRWAQTGHLPYFRTRFKPEDVGR